MTSANERSQQRCGLKYDEYHEYVASANEHSQQRCGSKYDEYVSNQQRCGLKYDEYHEHAVLSLTSSSKHETPQ